MTETLAQRVEATMQRARLLQQQRQAARLILVRYGACPPVALWARSCYASDEVRPYHLLFRIAERDN